MRKSCIISERDSTERTFVRCAVRFVSELLVLVYSVEEELRCLWLVFTLAIVKCWCWVLQYLMSLIYILSNISKFCDSNIHFHARQINKNTVV